MVNEIYNLAHSGLSDMISARAATNILKKALKSSGYSKADINYLQLKEIMQGYVFEELRNILPSQGVKRQIKNILRGIAEEHPGLIQKEPVQKILPEIKTKAIEYNNEIIENKEPVAIAQGQGIVSTYVNEIKAVFGKSKAGFEGFNESSDIDFDNILRVEDDSEIVAEDTQEEVLEAFTQDGKYDDISDDLFEAVSNQTLIVDEEELEDLVIEEPVKEAAKKKNSVHRKRTRESTDFSAIKLDDLEELLQQFSLVEEARAVAIVSTTGKLLSSRGKGFDLDKMASLSNMALMLLKKSGKIRSYHLSVDSSQLFLFPVAEHLIVVIGSQEINFGEVISVFNTFEEEI